MFLFSDLGSVFLFSLIRSMVKSCLNLDHIGTRLNMLSHLFGIHFSTSTIGIQVQSWSPTAGSSNFEMWLILYAC